MHSVIITLSYEWELNKIIKVTLPLEDVLSRYENLFREERSFKFPFNLFLERKIKVEILCAGLWKGYPE